MSGVARVIDPTTGYLPRGSGAWLRSAASTPEVVRRAHPPMHGSLGDQRASSRAEDSVPSR
ncbi:MAG: hypothetical protein JWN97_2421 [Nocardioides sp.]|nr:hypothetical protein [Nocardioides sp.]